MGEIPGFPGLVPFRKGVDPRRKSGSPNVGRRITAFFNELCTVDDDDRAMYDVMTLRTIAADPEAPHAKAIAATLLLAAREQGFDKLDRMPKSLAAIRELLDRMLGKPHASVTVEHTVKRSATEVLADMARVLPRVLSSPQGRELLTNAVKQNPQLADMLREIADEAPVDTTAIDLPDGSATWNGNDLVIRSLK